VAQQQLDPTDPSTAGPVPCDALAGYLRAQATEFLRSLRQHRETGGGGGTHARAHSSVRENGLDQSVDAARALRHSARRISGSLHTFRSLLDPDWSERMRPELAWLSGTLAREHAYSARLERLLGALNRLSGTGSDAGSPSGFPAQAGPEASTRFHAVADSVAVLASEVPLVPTATTADLRSSATAAEGRLLDAVGSLPLLTAGHPYNAEALVNGLSADTAPHPQDVPWHQVRLLLRLHRYAREVLRGGDEYPVDVRLLAAGQSLNQHRDAAEAASAAASAARTPRIAPATAYALGVLHADQRHEVEAARFAFQQSWQKEAVRTP
jgi:hypothetical protein